MTASPYAVSEELLRRFDRPGPRYTSYPTAVEFSEEVGVDEYHEKLDQADTLSSKPLSLYAHLPFCQHRCLFCGCNVVITPHTEVADEYLGYIKREIDAVAALLPNRRHVAQMQWGGGTPTYYPPAQIKELFDHIASYFTFDDGAEISIEVDPRVTSSDQLDIMVELGFNRLSMGVQDFTPHVQDLISRHQTFDQTARLIEHARSIGFAEGINIDLIYGLPGQELETFDSSLSQVLQLRPDRVAVYSFAFVPWIKGHQKKMDGGGLPSPDLKIALYLRAMERFLDAGYEPIGMDHFALPTDELARAATDRKLHRNFMGYTVKPASDMVAFGVSGIGDVCGGYFQNVKKLSTYYSALDAATLPISRGYLLNEDDTIRRYVITQLMCNFYIDKTDVAERFRIEFDEYFRPDLQQLAEARDAEFLMESADAITVTHQGRLFVRNICMAFDRHLRDKGDSTPVFSRTV
ncbi:MAG: oxygen-independent coproporphyrinogen III oxidase [Gemmatimonadales bacterium]